MVPKQTTVENRLCFGGIFLYFIRDSRELDRKPEDRERETKQNFVAEIQSGTLQLYDICLRPVGLCDATQLTCNVRYSIQSSSFLCDFK